MFRLADVQWSCQGIKRRVGLIENSSDTLSSVEESGAAIRTEGLTKAYDGRPVVDGLTMTVESGTVYGLLGPNGAGKTTTLRLLCGLLRPTSGSGQVAGVPLSERDRLVRNIGYMPDTPPLYAELTGREQLRCAAQLRDLPRDQRESRIKTLLGRFELGAAADERIKTYSKGMQQKLNVIQAILHEPDVVFLDEPTSGMDPRATSRLRETIRELRSNGSTVFLSTHILAVADELADRIGVFVDGDLVVEGTPDGLKEATSGGTLEDVFLELTPQTETEGWR